MRQLILTTLILLTAPLAMARFSPAVLKSPVNSDDSGNFHGAQLHKVNIIGDDNRKPLTESQRHQIGKRLSVFLQKDNGNSTGRCVGGLVLPGYVVTAAHCLFKHRKNKPSVIINKPMEVAVKLKDGGYEKKVHVEKAWFSNHLNGTDMSKGGVAYKDWAVLKLSEPIGKEFGTFGVPLDLDTSLENFSGTSYKSNSSGTQLLPVTRGCSIKGTGYAPNVVEHVCDTESGDSGMPLYKCEDGLCNLYAIHTGGVDLPESSKSRNPEFREGNKNYAVLSKAFLPVLESLYHNNGRIGDDLAKELKEVDLPPPVKDKQACATFFSGDFQTTNTKSLSFKVRHCDGYTCGPWKTEKLRKKRGRRRSHAVLCGLSATTGIIEVAYDSSSKPGMQEKRDPAKTIQLKTSSEGQKPNRHCVPAANTYEFAATKNGLKLYRARPNLFGPNKSKCNIDATYDSYLQNASYE